MTVARLLADDVTLAHMLAKHIFVSVQVATVTGPAKAAIEEAGGSVRRVYYNKLGMRALLLPDWFAKKGRMLPRAVQMVPYKKQWRYDVVGSLPPPDAAAALGQLQDSQPVPSAA